MKSKKVTLDDLIDIEAILLMIEDKFVYELSFNNIIQLDEFLDSIGKITNKYFNMVNEYKIHINNFKSDLSKEEKEKLFNKFNDRIVSDELEFDISPALLFSKEISINFRDKDIDDKLKSFF